MIIIPEKTHKRISIAPDIKEETIEIKSGASAVVAVESKGVLHLGITLSGADAAVDVRGSFVGNGEDRQNISLVIRQSAPRTSARATFRTALYGSSSSLFDGLIVITPEAEESSAILSYRALLLSEHARARPIPRLEIHTKKVALCRHEASVSNVRQSDLFYLQSRGMVKEEAQRLLVEGFLREAVVGSYIRYT